MSTGPLDATFARHGILVGSKFGSPTPGDSGQVAMALRHDGKILLASRITRANGDIQIARYKPNGSLDRSFGAAGKVDINIDDIDIPSDIVVQPDGRFLVLANSSAGDFSSRSSHLFRFLTNGRRDRTFASGGVLSLQPDNQYRHIILANDGAILLDNRAGGLLRLGSKGTVDAAFGAGGILTVQPAEVPQTPAGGTVVTDSIDTKSAEFRPSDHKFIGLSQLDFISKNAGGDVVTDLHTLSIRQYTEKGRPDNRFADAGLATIDMKSATGLAIDSISIADLAFAPRGKYFVAGHINTLSATGTGPDFILRLNPAGTIDMRFGNNGFFLFDHRISNIISADHGGIAFLARVPQPQSADDIMIGRLNVRGNWLRAFGSGGKAVVDFGGHDYPESLFLQPDGQFLLLSTRSRITSDFEFLSSPVIGRLNPNGRA